MDYLDLSPEQKQILAAQALRAKLLLGENSQQQNKFSTLAAASHLFNNPALAQAAQAAHQAQRQRHAPLSASAQGVMLPDGGVVESPIYTGERMMMRNQQRDLKDASIAQAAQAQTERLTAQKELQTERLEAQRQRASEANALRMAIAAMRGGGGGGSSTPTAAPQRSGKTLPAGQVEKLSKSQAVADAYGALLGSFKDQFGGSPLLANAQNALGRFVGVGYEDQSNWWQQYQEQTNMVRNQLFGSALTLTEREAFDRANIVPGMKPSEIRRRLAQQAEITAKGVRRLTENYGRAGYDVSDLMSGAAVAPPAPMQNAPQELQLPPGFKLIGPAP
jgi:hypothetical protein